MWGVYLKGTDPSIDPSTDSSIDPSTGPSIDYTYLVSNILTKAKRAQVKKQIIDMVCH